MTTRHPRIEGYAIVSADSMIADASGAMDALKFAADQQFFWASLDAAAAVAHGRHSAEGGPGTAGRHRLILTHRITAVARDSENFRALLWNPAGASFDEAWRALGAPDGALAVRYRCVRFASGNRLRLVPSLSETSAYPADGLSSQSSSAT